MNSNKFVTYAIRMPADQASRSAMSSGIRNAVETNGGEITGMSLEDEITLNELFEARLDDWDIREARLEAEAIEASVMTSDEEKNAALRDTAG